MGVETSENQSILASVDIHGGCWVLNAAGDTAKELMDQSGNYPPDLGFDEDDHPTSLGLHVWRGRIVRGGFRDGDRWDGEWSPATAGDLAEFGFPVPADETSAELDAMLLRVLETCHLSEDPTLQGDIERLLARALGRPELVTPTCDDIDEEANP